MIECSVTIMHTARITGFFVSETSVAWYAKLSSDIVQTPSGTDARRTLA